MTAARPEDHHTDKLLSASHVGGHEHRPDACSRKGVTVVGGGFCGAIFAHHVLSASPVPVLVNIVEARAQLGAGVAYSAFEPHQTTNVPTSRMSVYEEDPSHFERWLLARSELGKGGDHYPNRSYFGSYVDQLVRTTEPAHPASGLRHLRARCMSLLREPNDFRVDLDDGSVVQTETVVLATGNPVPIAPPPLAYVARDPRVILDPWSPGALAGVGRGDRILIVGIGLSMGEAVAGLRAAGHRGEVVAIARRGRRPERGFVKALPSFGDFSHRPTTAIALLRHFRQEVRRPEAAGLSWRSVAIAARAQGWGLWDSLHRIEKRRFARHLRPFWESLRHVMPCPVHDMLAEEERNGSLQVLAASLRDLTSADDGLHATLHRRGAGRDDLQRERFDAVLNCTGPAYAALTKSDPFWATLARKGHVQADGVGLGIAIDRNGRALNPSGSSQSDLLVLGTLGRGTFGELTGVPELSRQARDAAHALIRSWLDAPKHSTTPRLNAVAG